MITERTLWAEIMARRRKAVIVDLMEDGKVVSTLRAKNWIEARRLGIRILKATPEEQCYVRLHDINDASDVDFITRERLQKSTGLAKETEGKERKLFGDRKSDHTGNPTKEFQQIDSNYRCKRGRII